MTYKPFIQLFAAAALALSAPSCSHNAHEHDEHHHEAEGHDHDNEGEGHDHDHDHEGAEHGHGSVDEIPLKPSVAERFGVKTDTARAGVFHEVLEVSGRIEASPQGQAVVTAPRSGQVRYAAGITQGKKVSAGAAIANISTQGVAGGDANRAAKANLDAAKAEVERLRPLHAEGIVSTRDFNAAVAAYNAAAAAYSKGADSGVATAPASGVISQMIASEGQYVNAGDAIAAITGQNGMVVRADVPEKYYKDVPAFKNAKLLLPYADEVVDIAAMGGKRVSPASEAVSVTPGYIPVYFSVSLPESGLIGGYTQVYLEGSPRQGVITLPAEAISEQQGNFYVYQQLDEDCYRKLAVKLGQSDGANVEILQGVEPGMVIVTAGTTAVRLAETQAVAPEGHSHNH